MKIMTTRAVRAMTSLPPSRSYHCTAPSYGIKEFFDPVLPPGEVFHVGREWSVADLRRKVPPPPLVITIVVSFMSSVMTVELR